MNRKFSLLLCTILLLPHTGLSQSLYDSLKVHYKFSGNIKDSSGFGVDLNALSGSSFTYVVDRMGNSKSAIKLSGSNGLKSGSYTNKGWKEETLALWYKHNGNTNDQVIVQGADLGFAASLQYIVNDKVTVWMDGSSANAFAVPSVTADTFWHHIAITNDGSKSKIYWDGLYAGEVAETLSTATGSASSQAIYVGCSNSGYAYKGIVDEIMLYNRVLNQCEIRQIYNEDICPIFVYDTIKVPINDTTFITFRDTTYTTIYDTTHITVYDTTFIIGYDTIFVQDTIWTTVYDTIDVLNHIDIYDTTHVIAHDTIRVMVFDTTFITIRDTNRITVYETIFKSVTDTLYIDIPIKDSSNFKLTFKVYPNPSNSKFTVDLGNYKSAVGYKVKLYNIIGQLIEEQTIGSRYMEFDLSNRAKGHYVLVFTDKEDKVLITKRIILY